MIVTELQASEAINIIIKIIENSFGDDLKYFPSVIQIDPKTVREMYDLVIEMKEHDHNLAVADFIKQGAGL